MAKTRSKTSAAKAPVAQRRRPEILPEAGFRPSKPGFSNQEALELLGICTAANYLGPVTFAPFPVGLVAGSDPENPLPNDDGRTYPYPHAPIWPRGWTPGVPSSDKSQPWKNSILTSRLPSGAGVNSAIIAYHAERDAYAVAFAGTLNPGAAMQDLAGILIPAGPVQMDFFKSLETYTVATPDAAMKLAGGRVSDPDPEPKPLTPLVHLGYREAVESLTVGAAEPANLASVLKGIKGKEIDLYVTGHSLGASAAQLFSAWVQAGGIPSKKIHVKCYSFATPKSCNAPMATNYNLALGNRGISYNVNNSLDTAQQLPPTREVASDLINPEISSDLLSKAIPEGLYAASPLAPIVKMILQSPALKGAAAPGAPSPAGKPADAIPFPFSIPFHFLRALSGAAEASHPANGSHANGGPPSMAFVGMGAPHILQAQSPVVYNGKYYPPEYFPGRRADEPVPIPDSTTRQWWQHWPYTYAKYLADSEK
jgi:hypothetical protein